jgi:hypothetical protein
MATETELPSAREMVLERMLEVLKSVPGMRHVARNTLDVPKDVMPLAILLDGDETTHPGNFGKRRPPDSPLLITMKPEIYVIACGSGPQVGQSVNLLRQAVLDALRKDSTLLNLLVDRGLRYMGCVTALGADRSLTGELAMSFELDYLQP